MAKARTIQIFLPDGNPRGVKIAEITNRTIQTIFIPRASLAYALKRPELDNVGVYFLVGAAEDGGKPLVYIGETEECDKRLIRHNRNKEFWQYALVVISKTSNFTKSHVKFLEHYCIDQAKKAGQYNLENDNKPKQPHISEAVQADLLDNFEDIRILTSTLGYRIFETIEKPPESDILYCTGAGANARGEYSEDGLIVFKGSTCRLVETKSCYPVTVNLRKKLFEEGILKEKDGFYIFNKDYTFNSPSSASAVVLAKSSNGWYDWKYENGKTLHEVKRQG